MLSCVIRGMVLSGAYRSERIKQSLDILDRCVCACGLVWWETKYQILKSVTNHENQLKNFKFGINQENGGQLGEPKKGEDTTPKFFFKMC